MPSGEAQPDWRAFTGALPQYAPARFELCPKRCKNYNINVNSIEILGESRTYRDSTG